LGCLWRLSRWSSAPTHVRLLSFSRCGASRCRRGGLVGLRRPAPKEVHILVKFVTAGLAPELTHACATIVALELWRLWRSVRYFKRLEEPNA